MAPVNPPDIASNAASIPAIPFWFAFIASLVLTLIRIIELAKQLLQQARVELRVTREAFFRILPEIGESVYLHAICLSRGGTALIENITATLERTSGSHKRYELTFRNLGQKLLTNDGGMKYYFGSPSPLFYLQRDVPSYITCVLSISEYAVRIAEGFDAFQNEAVLLRESLPPGFSNEATQREKDDLARRVDEIAARAAKAITEAIQIENGSYELEMTVDYSQRILGRMRRQKSTGKIAFDISGDPHKRAYDTLVNGTLRQVAVQIIFPGEASGEISSVEVGIVNVLEQG